MLDIRKEHAITELIAGEQITTVAKRVGVSRPTLYSWLQDPEFKNEIEARRKQIVEEGNAYIMAHTLSHLEVLHNLAMDNKDKRTSFVAAAYLVDRSMGKMKTKLDINKDDDDKDFISVDMLAQELKEFDAED